jgi:hypothetical protein
MTNIRDVLLVLCLAGGIAGMGAAAARRDISMALLGLIVVTLTILGLLH